MTSLGRFLPDGLLARTRLATVTIGCLAILVQAAQLGNATKPPDYRWCALASILLLVAMLLLTHSRGKGQWWDLISLPVLVVLAGAGLSDPIASIALAIAANVVLALYGPTWMWAVRTVAGAAAIPVAVALSPMSGDHLVSWNSATVMGVLPQAILVSTMMRGIYAALQQREKASAREAVLLRLGRNLLGVTDMEKVIALGHHAAEEIVGLTPGSAALLLQRGLDGALRIRDVAALPRDLVGLAVPEAVLAGNGLEPIAPGLSGWNTEAYEQEMYMLTAGTRRLPAEFHDALTSAFHQVVLAVAGCRSHAELDHRANHDQLTQLPTRAKFFRRLAAEVDERMPGTVAVLNIDLDDFKQVNDGYGHAAGDELLIQVAERIATAGGAGSMAARFGGDEFAVMLTDLADPEQAERIAEQVGELICARLVAPVHLREATVTVGASIGVAVSMPGLTAGDLMRCADIAMYSAKVQGKNRVQAFRPEQHGDAAEHRTREKHLASAADRGEIRIGYRPQPDADTGADLVLESNVSWEHPLLGTVGRGDLMALAARTGNLQALGRHVVERTCAEIAAIPGAPVRFTIDVTGRQLRDPGYASMVLGALEQAGIDPERLELTVLGEDPLDPADGSDSLPARQLARLDASGVRVGLDAVHTHGFTLAMLRTYPIHRLTADENDAAAVALARTAGRVLGTRLVLRGAEADAPEMDHDEVAAWLETVTLSGRE